MVEPRGSSKTRGMLPPEGEEKNTSWERAEIYNKMTLTTKKWRESLTNLMILLKGMENVLLNLEAQTG